MKQLICISLVTILLSACDTAAIVGSNIMGSVIRDHYDKVIPIVKSARTVFREIRNKDFLEQPEIFRQGYCVSPELRFQNKEEIEDGLISIAGMSPYLAHTLVKEMGERFCDDDTS